MKRINEGSTSSVQIPDLPVLYVEDEEANWEVIELRLRNKYKLLWANTDKAACELVRKHDAKFYAVLMDVQLKGSQLDGLKLTQLLRGTMSLEQVPSYGVGLPKVECPVLFVTAFGNLYTHEQMVQSGGDAHLSKPVDFLKLTLMLVNTNARKAIETLQR